MKRILFIAKKGQKYSGAYGYAASSGLLNSATFVVEMLNKHNVYAKFVHVIDNNDIDREVTQYRPDVVILEALWVTPSKFNVLTQLHPSVQWVVRVHSEVPFLAQEGMVMQWLFGYLNRTNVFVAFNSQRALHDFTRVSWSDKLLYLPNYFPEQTSVYRKDNSDNLHVGCFGGSGALKNQLLQALPAIR